jgi:cytidylate kinase
VIVAIDGPAGAGKSSVARRLADRLGFHYLDTGAMYRAVTWLALHRGVRLDDGPALAELARRHPVEFGEHGVSIAGEDVTVPIRAPEIDATVPVAAAHPELRDVMRARQRALARRCDSVIEGRDIGVVVVPDAELKIWLTADQEVRARRRHAERGDADAGTLAAELARRDARDARNTYRADDAIDVDTSELTLDEVVDRICALVEARR